MVHDNVGLNMGSTGRWSGELAMRRFHSPGSAKAGFVEACTRMYKHVQASGLRRLYTILSYGEISVNFVNLSKITSNYSKTKENE
jgi:hypothetical protein